MKESDYLNPSTIRQQCSDAKSKLDGDNEKLDTALRKLAIFWNNPDLNAKGYDALRQQMEDYCVVVEAIRQANNEDISDLKTLKSKVGYQVLDGAMIFSDIRNTKSNRDNAQSNADYYSWAASYNSDNILLNWYYSWKASQYRDMVSYDNTIIKGLEAKKDKFDEIESATCGLFSTSAELRRRANNGLKVLGTAFTGVGYDSTKASDWREAMSSEIVVNLNAACSYNGGIAIKTGVKYAKETRKYIDLLYNKAYKVIKSGFRVVRKDGYIVVKGSFKNLSEVKDYKLIKGRRYREGSEAHVSSGLSRYLPKEEINLKNIKGITEKFKSNLPDAFRTQFKGFGKAAYGFSKDKKFLGNAGTALGYLGTAVNAFNTASKDIASGKSKTYTVADVAIGAGIDLGKMAVGTACAKVGAAIGTAIPIPVVGTVVGAAVGFGLGWLASEVVDKVFDDNVRDKMAKGVERGINKVKNALDSAADHVGKAFRGIALGGFWNKLSLGGDEG